MNKFKYISASLILVLFCSIIVTACKDDEEELSLSRQFSPSKISSVNDETQVTIVWPSSLFTTLGEVTYAVEISDNAADFTNPVYTATVSTEGASVTADGVGIIVTDDKLAIKKDYYARVKAIGTDERADSNWLVSGAFRILGEQFLLAVTTENVIDKSVRLIWKTNPDLTKIVITPTGGTAFEVNLTDTDKAATLKQIDNLTAGTTYTAEIFAGVKSKGTQVFTTKPAVVGNVIDLRGISVVTHPGILTDTLPDIAPGSIVLLKRGSSYFITASYNFNRTVTIQSGLDFGTNLASIKPIGSSTAANVGFSIAAGSTIDSLVFKDLVIKGSRTTPSISYNSDYFFNIGNVGTIGKIKFDNCTIKMVRGIVRVQTGGTGTKITNYLINNCVLDSIREYGVVSVVAAANAITNIKITNSTVSRARRFIIHTAAGNSSIAIENCTFNELVAGTASPAANYFIDFNTSNNTGGISIKNTIFGKVWDETSAGIFMEGIRSGTSTTVNVTNSYNTSDFVNNGSKPISGLSAYSGTAAALFTDFNNDNFKIKDLNFIGKGSAGDPRWR